MCTRRMGAACATAHRAEPGTWIFSTDRQKFWVALPSNHCASTVRPPMVDIVRVLPETHDRGVEADIGVDVVAARLEHQRVALGAELVGSPGWRRRCPGCSGPSAVDIDGSKTMTLSPRSPPPVTGSPEAGAAVDVEVDEEP